MNMMSLRSFTPPLKPPTPREILDRLVASGHRPYICTDPGFGPQGHGMVIIVWAKSVYKEKDLELVPNEKASLARVAHALDCDNVRQRPISPALEALLSSSFKLVVADLGELLLVPLSRPNEAKT